MFLLALTLLKKITEVGFADSGIRGFTNHLHGKTEHAHRPPALLCTQRSEKQLRTLLTFETHLLLLIRVEEDDDHDDEEEQ